MAQEQDGKMEKVRDELTPTLSLTRAGFRSMQTDKKNKKLRRVGRLRMVLTRKRREA